MPKIKSTKEMVYDARSNKTAMIEIEIQNWSYDPISKSFSVRVIDYAIPKQSEPIEGDLMPQYVYKNPISHKEVRYEREQIDALFRGLGNSVDLTESFTDELDGLIAQALLLVTQQDPIYRVAETGQISVAEDWILD